MNNNYLKNYISKGYVNSMCLLNEREINLLRAELEEEFKNTENDEGVIRKLDNFKNIELAYKIIKLFSNEQIKSIKKELKKISNDNVSILPFIEVHKNYHVNLKETLGWHRDCNGEMSYKYCKNILSKKNYLFSKVGIYLQNNTNYGGSIDIIKTSHKNFSKFNILIRKIKNIPLKIISLIHKYFNKLYVIIPESFFLFLINGKSLYPKKGSAVFFDSRIIHRGTPISKKNLDNVIYVQGKYKAYLPKGFEKYSIYSHFGTTEAVDSYMFDRLKRNGNADELTKWVNQIKFISNFDKKLGEEMNIIIDPIKKKYEYYL